MIVSQSRIAKYLRNLYAHTASYAKAAQKMMVPMIATSRDVKSNNDNYKHISIEHTESYRYNGNWYSYKDSEDRYWETFGILKIDDVFMTYQINTVEDKCFVGTIERLVYNHIINPFLLFIDGKVVPWDNIELVYDSGDTWIILRGPQFTNYFLSKASTFDIILFPFRCEFYGFEDDYSFRYKYEALSNYLNSTSYVDDEGLFHIRSVSFNTEVVYGNATTNIGAWVYKQIKYRQLGLLNEERINQLSHIDVSRAIYNSLGQIEDVQTYKYNIFDIDVPTDAIDNGYLYDLENIDSLPTLWFNSDYMCDTQDNGVYRFCIEDDDSHIRILPFNESYIWNLSDIDAMLFRENFIVFTNGEFNPEFTILSSINNITLLPNDDKMNCVACLIYNDESLHVLRNADKFKKEYISEQAILYFEALQSIAHDSGKGLPNSSKQTKYIDAYVDGTEFTQPKTINHISSETINDYESSFDPRVDQDAVLLNPSENSTINSLTNTSMIDAHLIPSGAIIKGIQAYKLDIEVAFVPSITEYIVYLSKYTAEQELAIELMSKLVDPLDYMLSLDLSYEENINNSIDSIISYDVSLLNPLYKRSVTSKCFTGKQVNESLIFDFMYENRRGIKVSRDRFTNRETYFMMFVNGELWKDYSETRCYSNFFFLPIEDDFTFNDNDNIEFLFFHGVNNNEIRFYLSDWLIDQMSTYDKDPTFYNISLFDPFINPKDLKIFSHYPKNILVYPTLITEESENIAFNISFRDEDWNLVIKKDALSHIVGENIRQLVESSGQTIPDEISDALDNVDIDTYKNILKDNTFIASMGTNIYNTDMMVTRNALVAVSSKKFIYQRLYVKQKSYRIKLDKRFRYCDNPKHYLLFINGRRMRQDSFLVTIPKHTRPFWDLYLYTAVFVDENDRIELFYLPYDMTDINFSEDQRHYIDTDGYFEFDRSVLDVPLSKDLYLFFINGKKIPYNKIIDVDSNTIRISVDTGTTRYPMVTAINLNTIPQVEDYLHSDSLSSMDKFIEYLKSHSEGINILDKLLDCDVKMSEVEDDKIWMNVAKIAILNEVIRDFWVTSGFDYYKQPFLYDYDRDDWFLVNENGQLGLPSLDANPVINIKRNDISLLYFYTDPENLVIEYGNNIDVLKFFWEYSQRFNQELNIISQTMNGIELGGQARYYETPFDPDTTVYKFIANTGQQFIIRTTEVSYANGIYWGRVSESELEHYRRRGIYQIMDEIVAVLPKDGVIPSSSYQAIESGNEAYYAQILDKNDIVHELEYGDEAEKEILPWIDPSLKNIYEEDFFAIDSLGRMLYNPYPENRPERPNRADDILLTYIDGMLYDTDPHKHDLDHLSFDLIESIEKHRVINYRDYNILNDSFMAIAQNLNYNDTILVSVLNDNGEVEFLTDTNEYVYGIDLDTNEPYLVMESMTLTDVDTNERFSYFRKYINMILAKEPDTFDSGESYNVETYNPLIAIDFNYRVYRNMKYDGLTSLVPKEPLGYLLLDLDEGVKAEVDFTDQPEGAQAIFGNEHGYNIYLKDYDGYDILQYDSFSMVDLDSGDDLGTISVYPDYKIYDEWYDKHDIEIKDIYGNTLLTTRDNEDKLQPLGKMLIGGLSVLTSYDKLKRFGENDVVNIEAYFAQVANEDSQFVSDIRYKDLSRLRNTSEITYNDVIYNDDDFMAIIANMQYTNSIFVSTLDNKGNIDFTNYVDTPMRAVDLDTGEVYESLGHYYLDDAVDKETGEQIEYMVHMITDGDPFELDAYANDRVKESNQIIYRNLGAETKFYITLPNNVQALSGTIVTYTTSRIVRDITYTLELENSRYYSDYTEDEGGLVRIYIDSTMYGQSLEPEDYGVVYPSVLSDFGIILDYDPYEYDGDRLPITPDIQGVSLEPEDYGTVYLNILDSDPSIIDSIDDDEEYIIGDQTLRFSTDKTIAFNDYMLESLVTIQNKEITFYQPISDIDLVNKYIVTIPEIYSTSDEYNIIDAENDYISMYITRLIQGFSLEGYEYGKIYPHILSDEDDTIGDVYDMDTYSIGTIISNRYNDPIVVKCDGMKAYVIDNINNISEFSNTYKKVMNTIEALTINPDYEANLYDFTDDNFFGIQIGLDGTRLNNIVFKPYYEEHTIETDTTIYTVSSLMANINDTMEPIQALVVKGDPTYNSYDPTEIGFGAILHDSGVMEKGINYIVDKEKVILGRKETLTDIYSISSGGVYAQIDYSVYLGNLDGLYGVDLDSGEQYDFTDIFGLSDSNDYLYNFTYNDLDHVYSGELLPIIDMYTRDNKEVYVPTMAIFHNDGSHQNELTFIMDEKEEPIRVYNFFNFEDGSYITIDDSGRTIDDIGLITIWDDDPLWNIDVLDVDKFIPLKFIYPDDNDRITSETIYFAPNELTEVRNIHHYNINSGSFKIIDQDTNRIHDYPDLTISANERTRFQNIGFVNFEEYKHFMMAVFNGSARVVRGLDYTVDGQADNKDVVIIEYNDTIFAMDMSGELIRNFKYENHEYSWSNQHLINISDDSFLAYLDDGNILNNLKFYFEQSNPERRHYYDESNLPRLIRSLDKHLFKEPPWIKYNKYNIGNENYFVFACPKRLVYNGWHTRITFGFQDISTESFVKTHSQGLTSVPLYTSGRFDDDGTLVALEHMGMVYLGECIFTNSYGYTERYMVWRTNGFFKQLLSSASINMEIKIAPAREAITFIGDVQKGTDHNIDDEVTTLVYQEADEDMAKQILNSIKVTSDTVTEPTSGGVPKQPSIFTNSKGQKVAMFGSANNVESKLLKEKGIFLL